MARVMSYFAEERQRNNNPNFYVRMRDDELRRNVKRIIRDIRNGVIDPQDFIYFKNDKIISACITESYQQYRSAEIIMTSLMMKFKSLNNIPTGIDVIYSDMLMCNGTNASNIWEERSVISNEMGRFSNKMTLWNTAYKVFMDISNGYDVQQCLYNLTLIDAKLFYDL